MFQNHIYSFKEIIGYHIYAKTRLKRVIFSNQNGTIVWLEEHGAFIVACFIKTVSYMPVQRSFHKKIKFRRHDSVPLHVPISKWVESIFSNKCSNISWVTGRKRNIRIYECQRIAKNCEWQSRSHRKPHFINKLLDMFLARYSTSNVKT